MEAYCRRQARRHVLQASVEYLEFLDAVRAAVAAECDDPLVRYWDVRFAEHADPDRGWDRVPPARTAEGFRGVLRRLPGTPYPAAVRVHMAWNAYVFLQHAAAADRTAVREGEVASAEDEFWRAFGELAGEDDRLSQETLFEIAHLVGGDYQERGHGRLAGWRRVDGVLARAGAAEWLRLAVEGQALVLAAWDARGSGWASTVTPEGWRAFGERLAAARDRLERAWAAGPGFAPVATAMIDVAAGLPLDRDRMEEWFRRAMDADPDCLPACRAKANYLRPEWHGSLKDQVDFGYQCYRTRNWYAHLPLLADLTADAAGGVPFPVTREAEYFYQQRQVFEDVRAVYEGYLAEYPGDRWARTRFALLLVVAGRPALAAPHFEALGERPWAAVFPGRAAYEEYRARALAAPRPATRTPQAPPPRAKE